MLALRWSFSQIGGNFSNGAVLDAHSFEDFLTAESKYSFCENAFVRSLHTPYLHKPVIGRGIV